MQLDMRTLVVVTGVLHLIQFAVLYTLYRVNRQYKGIGWWLLWNIMEVIGFGFVLLRNIPGLFEVVVILQNSSIIMGVIFIYNGVVAFHDRKINITLVSVIFLLFIIPFLSLLFIVNDITARGVLINLIVSAISLIIAYEMLKSDLIPVRSTIRVLAYTFIIHSMILLYRCWVMLTAPPDYDFLQPSPGNVIPLFDTIIAGSFWTFGFVLLINQRLNFDIAISNEHFQQIFQSSPVAVVLIERSTDTITECNSAFSSLSGFSTGEIIGKSTLELGLWESPADREQTISEIKAKGFCTDRETRFVRKSGEVFTSLLSAKLISLGGVDLVLANIQDVSDMKEVEDTLRKSEEKYRLLTETMPDLVVLHDLHQKIIYINSAGIQVSGYTEEELTGMHLSRLVPPELLPEVEKRKNLRFSGDNRVLTYRTMLLRKNGTRVPVEVRSSPILENGKLKNLLLVGRDVTDQERTLAELTAAKEKAEEMNMIKSYFFANMSHELRTPFVGIWGYAQLLSESVKAPGEKQMVASIMKSAERLTDTLNKILSLSQAEFSEVKCIVETVNLADFVTEIYLTYKEAADSKKINFVVNEQKKGIYIVSDPRILRSILNNLVSNAVKYTEEGKVELSVNLVNSKNRNLLAFTVTDTGIGIPHDKQEIIWAPFRQASEGRGRTFEGTGLGLSITKKYVELLGGTISLESEPGSGTVFKVVLPVDEVINKSNEELIIEEETPMEKEIRHSEKKLLYVEDDQFCQNIVSRVLSDKYYLDFVIDAEEALQRLKTNVYHGFLIDINLRHGLDGVQLMQKVKSMEENKGKPFVAITAYAAFSDRAEFLEKGFTHYLSKPFFLKELSELIDSIFLEN